MGAAQRHWRAEWACSASRCAQVLRPNRDPGQHGPRSMSWRCPALGAAVFILLSGVGTAGCSPSAPAAEVPTKPPSKPIVLPRAGAERPDSPPVKPDSARRSNASQSYVLTFEPRANPFGPPKPAASDRPTATIPVGDVKLLGVMNDGTGRMAAVEVGGNRTIVFAGSTVGATDDAEGLRIIQIRESDIVVGQSGRQWIVSLPRP